MTINQIILGISLRLKFLDELFGDIDYFIYLCNVIINSSIMHVMQIRTFMVSLVTGMLLTLAIEASANDNRFFVYNAANGLADNSAQTLACTRTGRLVITTMGQINFFDGVKFSYIDPSGENLYALSDYKGNYHLYFDKYHHIWLKDTGDVTCVNLTTERFVDSIEEIFLEFGVDGKVTDLFVDGQNEVWLLTKRGLFNVGSKRYYAVNRGRNLQDLEVYEDKYLMLFYDNGLLSVLDVNTGQKVHEGLAYDKQSQDRYRRTSVLYMDSTTVYQIRNGRNEGILLRFEIGKWQWETLMEAPYSLNNMAADDNGILYIPCAYGYWKYNTQTGEKTHIELLQMNTGGTLLTDINAIVFDKQGGMWAGTEKRGLLYARPNTIPFILHPWTDSRAGDLAARMDRELHPQTMFRGRRVNCVFIDSRGWTWVGTSTGLHCYKHASDKLPQVITRLDGLLNNVIHTVIEDANHNIWVGTSYGLSCLLFKEDGKLRYINSYNQWDNIPSESFVNGRSMLLEDSSIVMQMLDHVLEFNPRKMKTISKDQCYDIYPKMIRVMVNGNDMRTGQELDGNVILEKAISRTKELNLNYDQNSVSLTFSALNYFRPQQTYYRVRVNGLDNTWRMLSRANSKGLVDSQGQLHLPLVSLKPGSYTIEVQASMLPDKWDTVPYEWVVNINEPWWRTTGVIVLFWSVLLALLALNAYYYLRNAKMRTMRDSEERGIIKRVKMFADRCTQRGMELLEPLRDEVYGNSSDPQNDLSPQFVEVMERLLPVVSRKEAADMTMRELSNAVGMEVQPFYQLVTSNIYKSPRTLVRKMMLQKAMELLNTSDMDTAAIADACGFASPNYFIGAFFGQMKMTPKEYVEQRTKRKGLED